VVSSAPRIAWRLREEIVRLSAERVAIAEISRRVGLRAERLGLPQPSYQQVRVLVHEARRVRRRPTAAGVFLDVAMRTRPPDAVLRHVAGVGVPTRRAK